MIILQVNADRGKWAIEGEIGDRHHFICLLTSRRQVFATVNHNFESID
jgi:hypothetical protein